jgi:hypothetical protein
MRINAQGQPSPFGRMVPLASGAVWMDEVDGLSKRFDGLPWFLDDMRPQGFMGRTFASTHPELQLGNDPRFWSDDDVLRALALCGDDLPGNLVVGEAAFARFHSLPQRASRAASIADYPALADAATVTAAPTASEPSTDAEVAKWVTAANTANTALGTAQSELDSAQTALATALAQLPASGSSTLATEAQLLAVETAQNTLTAKAAAATAAAHAAVAAHLQGQFWEFHDMAFANQRAIDPESLLLQAELLSLRQRLGGVYKRVELRRGHAPVVITHLAIVGMYERWAARQLDLARGGVEQQGQVGAVGGLAHPECGCVGHGDVLLSNRHSGLKGHNRQPSQHRTRP